MSSTTAAAAAAAAASSTIDLKLDNDDDHPRRILKLQSHLLAYGGDDGTISLVYDKQQKQGEKDSSSSSPQQQQQLAARPIRRYDDDAVRAVAVSYDGKRVAVGFDSGTTQIYVYDDYDNTTTTTDHPFVGTVNDAAAAAEEDEDMLLSQSDILLSHKAGDTVWAGPCFDAPLRDLQFHPNSYRVAMATESGFCIVNVESKETISKEPRYLKEAAEREHDESGIRGLAYYYSSTRNDTVILASLAMDGRLCLWDVSSDDPNDWKLLKREASCCVTKKDVGEILGADAFDRSCRPHWMKSGCLALPGETYLQLRMIESSSSSLSILEIKDFDQPVMNENNDGPIQGHIESIVAMTSLDNNDGDNNYLITSGRDGRVIVWDIETLEDGALQAKYVRQLGQYDSPPTDIFWDKDTTAGDERLYIACANGSLVTIHGCSNIVPRATTTNKPHKRQQERQKEPDKTTTSETREVEKSTISSPGHRLSKQKDADTESDDDDDMFANQNERSPPKSRFVDDEAADDDDESIGKVDKGDGVRSALPQETADDFPASSPPDNEDDDASDDGFDMIADDAYPRADSEYQTIKLPEPQPAFAPSSTPLDLTRRFMCWNHIGSITLLQAELGVNRSSIDIDFTDSAFRRPISFTDNMGFILGSLGEDGGIFATDVADEDDLDDDDLGNAVEGLNMSEATKAAVKKSHRSRMSKDGSKPTGSSIYFHRFETFGSLRDKDWYLTLPDGERALGCACGEGWAAVITSRRFLRLFSSGGNQGQVVWLSGEPVTIVGRSRFLAVFYHEATPLPDGTQKLGYILFDASANRVIGKGSTSCISSGSSLSWAGFSNDGSLMAMDTDGMLSMLVNSGSVGEGGSISSWEWNPMLDTVGLRKSADDSFWPVTVYDGKLVAVPLKGGTKHPDATRRPVTTALGLRLPLARGTLAKNNALEELSVRADIALSQKKVIHDISTEGQEDEEFENEYLALSAQVDKVTLKMFAAVVEAGKLERALDLVERLHLEKSYDLAMTIADDHRKLVDLIEEAKDNKFGGEDEPEYTEAESPEYEEHEEFESQRITPDAASARSKRTFDEVSEDAKSRRVRRREAFA